MTIGKKFNQLSFDQYILVINDHKKYEDFNTLGLYRSLIENDKLSLQDKITIRDNDHNLFRKSFDFLQLKDPLIFVEVSGLGMKLTKGDEQRMWDKVKQNQQIILRDKRIRHRNFGTYSKHSCPYEDCHYKGLMVRPNSFLAWSNIHFDGDKNRYQKKESSDRRKSERKKERSIVNEQINDQ